MNGIFTAQTIEEAKQKAADAFGVSVSEIEIKVLEEPKRSLLGGLFGKKDGYRIEAVYNPVTVSEENADEAAEDPVETVAAAEETVADEAEAVTESTEASPEILLEKMHAGAEYLENVLAKLAPGVKCEGRLENGISFELSGENAGSLIGRRGDTLDALQYLTSMIANRGDREYVRLTIDTCGYREKRRIALQELAQRISKNVLRSGRSVALEPMNPYERRIIHSAVTAIEGVSSHSVGEEPNRKVVITSDSAPAHGFRQDDRGPRNYRGNGKSGDRRGRGGRHNDSNRRDRERKPVGEGMKKLDLSTSFEKDYKRPKPEDALNAGVYGKIDI